MPCLVGELLRFALDDDEYHHLDLRSLEAEMLLGCMFASNWAALDSTRPFPSIERGFVAQREG